MQYAFANSSWESIGGDIPGPVTAVEVNNGNAASIFAAGRLVIMLILCISQYLTSMLARAMTRPLSSTFGMEAHGVHKVSAVGPITILSHSLTLSTHCSLPVPERLRVVIVIHGSSPG